MSGGCDINGQGQVYVTGIDTRTNGEAVAAHEGSHGHGGNWSFAAYATDGFQPPG